MSDKKIILIFDDECTLCNRFKKGIELLDIKKLIRYVPVGDDRIYFEFPELNKELCEEEIHLIDIDRNIYAGGEVVRFLIGLFPTAQKFAWLLDSDSSRKAIDSFYGRISDMRKLKKTGCPSCGKKKTKRL
jgi:predicted DCC family thiol-disulfide oxidoreductase YuxK